MSRSRDVRRLWLVRFGSLWLGWYAIAGPAAAAGPQCVDFSGDPAGCQPSTFKTPMAQMPTVRVNRQGVVDPASSEEDARAGAAKLEKDLHLFRNFEHLHWVLTVPSMKDPATGRWKGGDLDGAGDARGLGIGGNCIFVGLFLVHGCGQLRSQEGDQLFESFVEAHDAIMAYILLGHSRFACKRE